MNLVLPLALLGLLGGCQPKERDRLEGMNATRASQKVAIEAQRSTHSVEKDEDWSLRADSVWSEPHLMATPETPWIGVFKVKPGDIAVVTFVLKNRKKPRRVVMTASADDYAGFKRDGIEYKKPRPAVPGGFDILEVKGLETPLADGEARPVSFKIRFNSDLPQSFGVEFTSPDDPGVQMLDNLTFRSNMPEDLARHEWAIGNAKNPWPESKK